MSKVAVLRWGHRSRDQRLTTHVALAARALGASKLILTDTHDRKIQQKIEDVTENWGGHFHIEMGVSWKQAVKKWRGEKGVVVHLTAYGENIETSDVLQRIKATGKDVLIIVGCQKVPSEFFSKKVSDFNVAIGNQPHSECSSLAIFLDHYFEGRELKKSFEDSKIRIIPQMFGKETIKPDDSKPIY